ncbi:MAG: hypothetical protein IJA60_02570 [Clostridia bacterium]|nr:hypothetical protein [Clostridia bacterium]
MSVNEKMTAIADAIREYGDIDGDMSLDEMATHIPAVYEHGYGDGQMEGISQGEKSGYATGYARGKQDENDRFWDDIQSYGNRTNYNDAFKGWGAASISPKYTITANQLYQFIHGCANLVTFDWSKVIPPANGYVSCYSMANGDSKLVSVDTDLIFSTQAGATAGQFMFANCKSLVRVQKIYSTAKVQYTNAFQNCESLVDIEFDGVIANDIDTHWSPLSKVSIESKVSHLSDDVSGKTATFNKAAVLAAFGTEEAWLAYVASKPNWNFVLI